MGFMFSEINSELEEARDPNQYGWRTMGGQLHYPGRFVPSKEPQVPIWQEAEWAPETV